MSLNLRKIFSKNKFTILPVISFALIFAYLFCMILYPVFFNTWEELEAIWARWQALNVGMLAFTASIIALYTTRYRDEQQKKREFNAARAFLPDSLSQIWAYLESTASILENYWVSNNASVSHADIPVLPNYYRDVFRDCIKYSDDDVGKYLSMILSKLQILNARLRDVNEDSGLKKTDIIVYLYNAAEIRALIAQIYKFARGESPFNVSSLTWSDFQNVYFLWFKTIDEFKLSDSYSLQSYTMKRLDKDG